MSFDRKTFISKPGLKEEIYHPLDWISEQGCKDIQKSRDIPSSAARTFTRDPLLDPASYLNQLILSVGKLEQRSGHTECWNILKRGTRKKS